MNIYLGGSEGKDCFYPKIKKELFKNNNQVFDLSEADVVFFANPTKEWMEVTKAKGKIKAKFILNVLDIPANIYRINDIKEFGCQLKSADRLTCISKFTQSQLKYYYGLYAEIVGYPIMDIKYNNTRTFDGTFKYLHVGRRVDPNKHYSLIPLVFKELKEPKENLLNIGREPTNFGKYVSYVEESDLNIIYNSCDFCFCLGKVEGLSLTIIESMAAGCIPIIHNELTTRQEILPSIHFPEYDHCYKHPEHLAFFIQKLKSDRDRLFDFRLRLIDYYNKYLKEKFSAGKVCENILKNLIF